MRPARYEPEDIWALHGRIGPVAEHIRAKNADIYTLPRCIRARMRLKAR